VPEPARVVATTPRDHLALHSGLSEDGTLALVGSVLAAALARRVAAGRPAAVQARARVAADAGLPTTRTSPARSGPCSARRRAR
jgi:hypothetical protein